MPRLFKLILASGLACLLPALAADAALAGDANMRPSVQGFGTVTTTSYSCSNFNQDDRSLVTSCGTRFVPSQFSFPVPIDAVIVMVATPFSNPGNQFARWEGCTNLNLPIGTIGSAVAAGNVCTLTVSFFSAVSPTLTPRAVFDDVAGPTISSVIPSYSTVTDRGVSFGVNSNESMSVIECSVDGGAFSACSTVRTLSEGTHQVRARSRDLSGNLGNTTANQNFRIIDTALVSGPTDFSTVKRPTFTYSTLAGLNFECSIDSVAISTPCGTKNPTTNRASFTPPADLPDGVHTFRVEAIDGPDFDRVPIVRTWTIDTVAPNTTLVSPDLPEGVLTTLLNANFTFASTEPVGAVFQCRLDPAPFAPCTSPKTFSDLAFGKQKFEVRAVDRAGNVDASPAVRNWEIAAADNDGDGFNQRSDCNDADAAINPGRPEINDNGIDEDCDGVDGVTPPPPPVDTGGGGGGGGGGVAGAGAERIVIGMPFAFSKSTKKFTIFTVLQIRAIPIASTLKVTCKAPKKKKCPGGKSFTKRNAFGTVSLKKWLKKKLRAGTKLTATVTKPGNFIGAVKIMTVKKKARPSFTDRCIAPGTTKAVGC